MSPEMYRYVSKNDTKVSGPSLHVLGGQLAYIGDVHPGHLVDHVGHPGHDVQHLPGESPRPHLALPGGNHRDLLGLGQRGRHLSSNLSRNTFEKCKYFLVKYSSDLGQGLQHHVNHGGLFVLFPGVSLFGHLLCLSLGLGLNGIGLCLSLQSNGLGLCFGLNDQTNPEMM